jgi:hypothetical protein
VERTWIGPEYWANRLQDWQLHNGRIECLVSDWNRNINLLTCRLEDTEGTFTMSVHAGFLSENLPENEKNWIGFRIGARGQFNDYRDDAIYGKGLDVGVTTSGDLFIGELPVKQNRNAPMVQPFLLTGLKLEVEVTLEENIYLLHIRAIDPETNEVLAEKTETDVPQQSLHGSLALVSHFIEMGEQTDFPSTWFAEWHLSGSKVRTYPDRTYGPILFSQYTLSRGTLYMTAQMPPIGPMDAETVELQMKKNNQWERAGVSPIHPLSRTAHFTVNNWDSEQDIPYRLYYRLNTGKPTSFYREGIIRKEPVDKEEIVVAGFTGNNDLGFPNNDVYEAIQYHDPDLLFFSGDQIYEGVGGFGVQRAPFEKAVLDYLRKWYLLGWEYGNLMRDRPTISIPDDHDVYHGNLWGAGGIATPPGLTGNEAQDAGGYKMPAEWVNMVQATQTSHLPHPPDPTPVAQDIGVYFTEVNYGGISFAVIEDRKFKSAPKPLLPEAKINNGWAQNTEWDPVTQADVPGAVLLGDRQLDFMEHWAGDWSNHTWMKAVLSQTIFANVATLPADEHHDRVVPQLRILEEGEYPPDDRPVADLDSDGWPQTGRNKAIEKMRKAFALHIAGDQHLGSTIQYGVDTWRDAGYALCVPAISNVWPRRWFPKEGGLNREPGAPKYTGDFLDGFGNHITVKAVSNPVFTGKEPSNLYDRATGYGIVRFYRSTRDIKIECWPRFIDPEAGDAQQYPGWPVTINQMDNYSPAPYGYLPKIRVEGMQNPVLKVFYGPELVYALRILGTEFQPTVYAPGLYQIEIGDPDMDKMKVFDNVEAIANANENILLVNF